MDQASNDEWLTIVTLQVSFKKTTFEPSFRDKLAKLSRSKKQCSCSYLSDLHPTASIKDLVHGWLPLNIFTVQFIMTSPGKIKQAKRLCTPQADQEFGDLKTFRFWILSLATQLSELCESDHTQDGYPVLREPTLRPFKSGDITKITVCEEIRRILTAPLNPSEEQAHGMGYVYVLRSQMGVTTLGELKIGFSKYHPEHRAHELARCLARPEIVSHTPLLPHAKRLESIIHTELQACRKIQSCPRCDKDHREWFTVAHANSREVVTRWSTWILQRPYRDGKLINEWNDYLTKQDFAFIPDSMPLAEFWKIVIDKFPRVESKDTKSQHVGKYLNECYWDFTCEQFGLTLLGKSFCDSLREDSPMMSSGGLTSMRDLSDNIDALAEKLHDIQAREEAGKSEDWGDDDLDRAGIVRIEDVLRPIMSPNHPIHPDMLIGTLFDADSPFKRMFHPKTKVGHVLLPDRSPGPLLRLIQRIQKESTAGTEDVFKLLDVFKTVKTGAMSVSDPTLGISESPLGDATMLPVLSLRDLKYFNVPVANWVGMSPTNAGYQYLQEAYESGKWFGQKPRFKLPKAYRRAGYKSLSAKDADNGPSSGRRMKEKAKDGDLTSTPLESDVDGDQKDEKPSFTLTRGPDFDSFTWSTPMNDEFVQQVNQGIEEIRNGGRANLEKKLARSLRHVGLDAFFDIPYDEDTTDSDSSDSDESSSSEEQEKDLHPASSSASPSKVVGAKRKTQSSTTDGPISAKKAKLWLDSL